MMMEQDLEHLLASEAGGDLRGGRVNGERGPVSRQVLAAHRREESRGAHTRDDFPDTDHHHWGKVNSVISMGEGREMRIDFSTYPEIPDGLRSLLDADDLQEEE